MLHVKNQNNDKQISRHISTIVFSNALVETLLIKLGDSALNVLFGSYRKQNEYNFSLNVILKRNRRCFHAESTTVFKPWNSRLQTLIFQMPAGLLRRMLIYCTNWEISSKTR